MVNVFFPFSPMSLRKSVSYVPASYEAIEYQNDIKQFKEQFNENNNELVKAILPLYNNEWLYSVETLSFNKRQFDDLLKDLTQARSTMNEFREGNTAPAATQTYLNDYLLNLESLEVIINELKNSQWLTRNELKNELRNVQTYYRNSFILFNTFCEVYEIK